MTTTNNTLPLLASYTPGQIEFIKFLQAHRSALTVYDTCTVSRKDLVELLKTSPYIAVPAWIAAKRDRRAGRGNYLIPELAADVNTLTVNANKRGRKPGSPNKKGRAAVVAPTQTPAQPQFVTTNA
ncbi:MAG: hypothetical protein EBT04_05975 [Betaproteobacteria bacterium]|nr:hypothetical protein [Betaproteobacteria bacterium]